MTAHRLGSSTWFDFGSPTCRSLMGFGKHPMENNSAAAGTQATSKADPGCCELCSRCCRSQRRCLGLPTSVRTRSTICSEMEPQAPGTPRGGGLTSQGCFVVERETHLFSDASQICKGVGGRRQRKVVKSNGPSVRMGRAESTFTNIYAYLNIVPGA